MYGFDGCKTDLTLTSSPAYKTHYFTISGCSFYSWLTFDYLIVPNANNITS